MLRTRPWWRAPLALVRRPGLAVSALAAGTLVGVVGASPTLFVDTAGSGAVSTQWDRACPGDVAPHITFLTVEPPPLRRAAATVAGFGALDVTSLSADFTFRNGDASIVGGLLDRDDAVQQLNIVESVATGDVWISDTTAAALGVGAGATVTMDFFYENPVEARVKGVFTDFTLGRLDDYWCGVDDTLRAPTSFTDDVPPPKSIVDPDASFAVRKLVYPVQVIVPFERPPRTVDDASRLVAQTEQLQAVFGEIPGSGRKISATEGITRLAARAESVRRSVSDAIRPLAWLTLACALLVASLFGVMWARARHNDVVALTSLGVSPGWIGLRAALEALGPVMIGSLTGAAIARLLLSVYAPSTHLEPGTATTALFTAAACGAALVALIGLTSMTASRGVMRAVRTRLPAAVRWAPWELVIAVGAWRSYRSFRSGSLIELRGDDAVVASSAIAFPLLCFLTASVIVARLWVVSLRRGTRSIRRVPTGLALRRLQHGRRTGSVFVALGALAVAVSLYGAGLVASLDHTQAVKTGVYVGSDVSVRVRVPVTTAVEGATQVRHRDEATYEGTDVGLLAVDPRSFEQAAFWDDSFSEQSLGDLMLLLRSPTASGSAPAIVVGNLPPTGTLGNTKGRPGRLDIEVVAVARAFPGLDDQPLVVIGADAAERSEFKFSYDVWARGDVDEWRRRLAALGVGPVSAVTRNDVVTSSELLFASWTFVFVRALGVFVAGLVVVSLALQLVTRQRQQALGFGILRRMGVSARLHRGALMLEALALGLAMFAGGALAAAIASRTVAPRVDPLPVIPPGPTSVTPVAALAAIVAAVAVTCLAGASVAQRVGSQVNLAMGLRDD